MMSHLTIISGGQTGVDTAAIQAANTLQIPYRGWVPHAFTNEGGTIFEGYRTHLRKTPSPENAQRTEWNMRDADMILTILRGSRDQVMGGTKLGLDLVEQASKPMCFVDLTCDWKEEVAKIRLWLGGTGGVKTSIAVGGPRERVRNLGYRKKQQVFLLEPWGAPIPSNGPNYELESSNDDSHARLLAMIQESAMFDVRGGRLLVVDLV